MAVDALGASRVLRRADGDPTVAARELAIAATDGYPLAATVFEPPAARGGGDVALIASSLGGDRRRYAPFARFLAVRGWTAVTFDFRGIGGSRNSSPKPLAARLVDWGERDVAGIVSWAAARPGARRLVAVGHSMGGQILGLAADPGRLDALVLVASQAGYWRLRPRPWRYLVLGYFRLVPALVRAFGGLPLWPTGPERLPPGVALEWRRWCLRREPSDLDGRPLAPLYERFRAPILAFSFADDHLYAPRAAAEALLALYRNAPREHRHYRPRDLAVRRIGHRGFWQGPRASRLWEETWRWLEGSGARSASVRHRRRPAAE